MKLPWAEPSSRLTALFEALATTWLKAASQQGVGRQLGLSEATAINGSGQIVGNRSLAGNV